MAGPAVEVLLAWGPTPLGGSPGVAGPAVAGPAVAGPAVAGPWEVVRLAWVEELRRGWTVSGPPGMR